MVAAMAATQTFAELCREQRQQRYETQASMARQVAVSERTWRRWENGAAIPRTTEAVRCADVCGLPAAVVMEIVERDRRHREMSC